MTATIIDGKAIAATVREQTRQETELFFSETGRRPGLATVLVGDDPASHVYVASKRKQCVAAGMLDMHQHVPASISQETLEQLLRGLALDPTVSGILLQLPLPGHLDTAALIDCIPPSKDVDGLTTTSAGLLAQALPGLTPCTPAGVIELLDASNVAIEGTHAVVVGRSQLVGKPLAQLLLQRNATVTICHSRTRNLESITRTADILIAAAGVPNLINAGAVRPGATVIDVGIHRTDHGLVGDVNFSSVADVAGAVTPVPGGVGPMTIAMLLRNTLTAAKTVGRGADPRPASGQPISANGSGLLDAAHVATDETAV